MPFSNGMEMGRFTPRRPACLLLYADLKKLVGGASVLANRKILPYFKSHDVLGLLHLSDGTKQPGRSSDQRNSSGLDDRRA